MRFLGYLLLIAALVPLQIVLIPSARILGLTGLAGTITGLVLIHAIYGLGFTTLFFRNYYEAFPTELIKAAQIDGAGFFRIFWRIVLPLSPPTISQAATPIKVLRVAGSPFYPNGDGVRERVRFLVRLATPAALTVEVRDFDGDPGRLTSEQVLSMMEKNTILTPPELVSFGLADAILK